MRSHRGRRIIGLIATLAVLVTSMTYWWFIWKPESDFKAFQSRVGSWGGGVARSLDFQGPLMRFRGNGPSFIDPFLGTDGYHLSIHGGDPTGEQISELLSLSPIRSLSIAAVPRFSDDQILGIGHSETIRGLHLNDVNVTDRSLDSIARMTNLSEFSLVGTSVTDATVALVAKLPKINNVYVGGPNIRSIRLIEARAVDGSGSPAVSAEGPISFRGQIAIESAFGKPGNIRLLVRSDGDSPPWMSHPYGWNAGRQRIGSLVETSPGIWSFDLLVNGVLAGHSNVETWVDQVNPTGPIFVHYRLTSFSIDLKEPSRSDREPTPPR